MRYNLMFPTRAVKHWSQWCQGASIGEVANLVEQAGFDAFSMSEHPYPDRVWLANGGHHAFDPFVSLSFAAAATTHIRVMTYILVSGYRSPYLTNVPGQNLNDVEGTKQTINVDFASSWNVTENFQLTLEALNLTNQFQYQYVDTGGNRVNYYHQQGRDYLVGARYKL